LRALNYASAIEYQRSKRHVQDFRPLEYAVVAKTAQQHSCVLRCVLKIAMAVDSLPGTASFQQKLVFKHRYSFPQILQFV
jgi:hypothetical protein